MNRILSFLCISLFLLSGCADPYIGRTININSGYVCSTLNNCIVKYEGMIIHYSIEKIGATEYEINGYASMPEGKTKTWRTFSGAFFMLYLVEKNQIFDVIQISGGTGGMEDTITFSRKFNSVPFKYTLLSYEMRVKG